MSSKTFWLFSRIVRRLWFRATAFSAIAVGIALLALVLKRYVPYQADETIGADAVGTLLNILAASMLSVTIFSVSTLVSALSAAASGVTPRAVSVVAEDDTAQNALAIFLGSFLYSLVGIIALQTGLYGDKGRVFLFVVTLAVIAVVVATMLRWIDHVAKLGRVGETLARLEQVAAKALESRRLHPHLDGTPWPDGMDQPNDARPVHATRMGYVQHVDVAGLQSLAEEIEGQVYLAVLPGNYVDTTTPIAWLRGSASEDDGKRTCRHISIGEGRSFDQDPRFAVSVLAEVASRALSPAVNDPGTAIDVLGRLTRVLASWHASDVDDAPTRVVHRDVHIRALLLDDLFDDAFTPIGRDGAGLVEVVLRMQKMLHSLAQLGHVQPRYAHAARRHAREGLARAKLALTLPDDIRRVEAASERVLR